MAELVSLLSTSYIIASNIVQSPFRREHANAYPLTHLPFSSQTDLTYALRRFDGGRRHKRHLNAFLAGIFLDIRGMRKLEEEVLNNPGDDGDEMVMAFKSSHLEAVGGTQLTSAILAQLSMTTLQLDGLSDMHWSASGFMLSGILFGVVAVILATMQQQVFGMLNDPMRVKLWLSCGYYEDQDEGKKATSNTGRRLKASVASLQIMRLPNTFLSIAAFAFLVSIGLFLGFSARQDLNRTPGRDNNKAVLILWLVTAFVAVSESAGCGIWKIWEDRKVERMSGMEGEGKGIKKNGRSDEEEAGSRLGDGVEESADERTRLLENYDHDGNDTSHAKRSGDGLNALAKALEASAKAHARCAEADKEVARLMQKQSV